MLVVARVVVEAATASVDMHHVQIRIGWLLVERVARRYKGKFRVLGATEAHQDPDRRQAVEVGGKVADDGFGR